MVLTSLQSVLDGMVSASPTEKGNVSWISVMDEKAIVSVRLLNGTKAKSSPPNAVNDVPDIPVSVLYLNKASDYRF